MGVQMTVPPATADSGFRNNIFMLNKTVDGKPNDKSHDDVDLGFNSEENNTSMIPGKT